MITAGAPLLLSLGLSMTSAPPSPPAAPTIDARLDGVAMLINERNDGKTGWGAAILLDDNWLALTNLHVVADSKRLLALLHDEQRPSYTAAEGGLSRTLFERAGELLRAELVRGDPTTDLAIVRIHAGAAAAANAGGQRARARLRFATAPPSAGDVVVAVGHPGESLWSVSRGTMGAVRDGFLQHDAPLAPGSSGGPLLDARGDIVGINTLMLGGEARGFSLARPAALAHPLVGDVVKPLALDLSTPEVAARSCARARELGSERVADCIDWQHHVDQVIAALDQGLKEKGAKRRGLIIGYFKSPEVRRRYIEAARLQYVGNESGDDATANRGHDLAARLFEDVSRAGQPLPPGTTVTSGWLELRMTEAAHKKLAKRPLFEASIAAAASGRLSDVELDQRALARNGLRRRIDEPEQLRELLRLGLRIDGALRVDDGTAWVFATGRNRDKSLYRYSSRWVRSQTGGLVEWRERLVGDDDPALATLPRDAPRTIEGAHHMLATQLEMARVSAPAAMAGAGPEGIVIQFRFVDDQAELDVKPSESGQGFDIKVTDPRAGSTR